MHASSRRRSQGWRRLPCLCWRCPGVCLFSRSGRCLGSLRFPSRFRTGVFGFLRPFCSLVRHFFLRLLRGFYGRREETFYPQPCGTPSDATCILRLFHIGRELLICGYAFCSQELGNRGVLSLQSFV